MVSSGISDVVFTSVYSEEVDDDENDYYNNRKTIY